MFYINDEEITRLHSKLMLLTSCIKIKEMGYRYNDNECVILDIFAADNGYSVVDEYEIIHSIIRPTLGDEGTTFYNGDETLLLESIGAKVPINIYDKKEIVGCTIHSTSAIAKKFFEYKLKPDASTTYAIKSFSDNLIYNESNVETVQIIFQPEGLYIVCPEPYTYVEEFLDSYLCFLDNITRQVEQHEERMKEEVA